MRVRLYQFALLAIGPILTMMASQLIFTGGEQYWWICLLSAIVQTFTFVSLVWDFWK